jgi:serine/threonine protein kinase
MSENDSADQPPDEKPRPPDLRGLDPGELLARGLNTVQPSGGGARWEPPEPAELGPLFPQYLIEGLLGRGGMGAVYKAVHVTLDRRVAIKLLPAEMAADEQFVARFQREARTLARLDDPGIVRVYDFGQTTGGFLYFVMEYVDGTDLRRILRGPGLAPDQALTVISQICNSLHIAHLQGVIHRDIKPENILITNDGNAKLADFGLARPADNESSSLTGTDVVMGTPDYMAPEQRSGQSDKRTDVFALGVMLYEMLTGQTPRGVFEPPSRKVQLDVRIDEVVLKALQMEPERRYQHAGEMKTDVDRIRSTPPRGVAQKGEGARRQPVLKRPVFLMGIAALALLCAAFFVWRFTLIPAEGIHAPDANRSSEGKPVPGREYVNFLRQKFVPLPSAPHLLFCIWETRVKDFEAFANETGYASLSHIGAPTNLPLKPSPGPLSWRNPGFPQTGDHPVVGISVVDANAFCRWLTKKARDAGRLEAGQEYRLPTDREWSAAMGVVGESGDFPLARKFPEDLYSWGKGLPPPENAENLAGEEQSWAHVQGYRDPWVWTAPVGSGKPNRLGLFDLTGNVREFCKDRRSFESDSRSVRGSCFLWPPGMEKSGGVRGMTVGLGNTGDLGTGFRCILDLKTPDQLPLARRVESAVDDYIASAPSGVAIIRARTDFLVNDEMAAVDLCGSGDWPNDDQAAPFRGLPLDRFYLIGGSLKTLAALKGMPLKVLSVDSAKAVSFDGVRGMALEWFAAPSAFTSSVADLEAFRGMKLKGFHLNHFPRVTDLSPLRGQPIQALSLFDCGVSDLTPVKDAPLRELTLSRTKIQSVDFLDWWPTLADFSGMDDVSEVKFVKPALDALCSGDETRARQMMDALETRLRHPPWLNRNMLFRDMKGGMFSKFARWAKGDRLAVTREMKVHGGHAYLLVPTAMHWLTARSFAEHLGGHLVTVTSKDEDDFIRRELLSKIPAGAAWLGLESAPQVYGWKWVTGEPFNYNDWDQATGAGQASRDSGQNYACWHPNGNEFHWWDWSDFNPRSVIVEWETPNPQDGLGR